jgi:hypothetical protein
MIEVIRDTDMYNEPLCRSLGFRTRMGNDFLPNFFKMYEIKAKKHFKLKASNFSGEGVTIADIDPIVLNTSY